MNNSGGTTGIAPIIIKETHEKQTPQQLLGTFKNHTEIMLTAIFNLTKKGNKQDSEADEKKALMRNPKKPRANFFRLQP